MPHRTHGERTSDPPQTVIARVLRAIHFPAATMDRAKARDQTQPLEAVLNALGYYHNAVQRLTLPA